jgi:16S rRNA (cytidine1402-2'-O)-methyltransferase
MLILVPGPIGNLEDITLRALRVLKEADLILAEDTRTSGNLLKHFGISKPVQAYHQNNEHRVLSRYLELLRQGTNIALLSDAGTPGISDPGFLLLREALKEGIGVECLPGPTALIPALVQSGLPCDRFFFAGFLPPKKGRQSRLAYLATLDHTFVLYESPHKLLKTLQQLIEHCGPERPAAISRELSKLHEETIRGSLLDLETHFRKHEPRGEFVVTVGTGQTEHHTDGQD